MTKLAQTSMAFLVWVCLSNVFMLNSQTIDYENTVNIMKSTSQRFFEVIEVIWFHRKEIAVICNPHYSAIKIVINDMFLSVIFIRIHNWWDRNLTT